MLILINILIYNQIIDSIILQLKILVKRWVRGIWISGIFIGQPWLVAWDDRKTLWHDLTVHDCERRLVEHPIPVEILNVIGACHPVLIEVHAELEFGLVFVVVFRRPRVRVSDRRKKFRSLDLLGESLEKFQVLRDQDLIRAFVLVRPVLSHDNFFQIVIRVRHLNPDHSQHIGHSEKLFVVSNKLPRRHWLLLRFLIISFLRTAITAGRLPLVYPFF